jgi:hypothetical protein
MPSPELILLKLAKASHLVTELVVSLIVNHEEHLSRAIADTSASSRIVLDSYTSFPFIKTNDSNTINWIIMGGKFTTNKTVIWLGPFHSQNSTNFQEKHFVEALNEIIEHKWKIIAQRWIFSGYQDINDLVRLFDLEQLIKI